MSVYSKLQKVRVEFQSLPLKKSGMNKFAGYNYFELGDFLPAINVLFESYGLCSIVSFTAAAATLRIVDIDDMSEIVFTSPMGSAALKGCHEVQNIGACETYQRRYLYITALEIVEHDALDATTGNGKSQVTPTAGVFESLPEQDQAEMKNLAMEIIDKVTNGQIRGAVNYITAHNLDTEQKTALWSLLDSKVRSSIKKEQQRIKDEELVTQP